MKFVIKTLFGFLVTFSAAGTGLPVFDGARAFETYRDYLTAGLALSELAHEFTGHAEFLEEIIELQNTVNETNQLINDLRELKQNIDYVTQYDINRFKLMVAKIRSLTDVIRRIKAIVAAVSVGTSSQSISMAVQMIRNERERLNTEFRMKFALAKMKHEAKLGQRRLEDKVRRRKRLMLLLSEEEQNKYRWAPGL